MGNQLLCCDSANRIYHSESTIKKFDQPEFGNKVTGHNKVNNTLFYEAELYRQIRYRRRRRRRRRTKTL